MAVELLAESAGWVEPVRWRGTCGRCGEPASEDRDSPEQAQRDIDECPCRAEWGD